MQSYTPPLGTGSTKDYDRAIRLWTREKRWRAAMLAALAPKAGETVVDVGCGTGSFALMLKQAEPRTQVIGLDPDAEALDIARHKAAVRRADIDWRQGFARDVAPGTADAVVSSLVLHQMPVREKALMAAAARARRPSLGLTTVAGEAGTSCLISTTSSALGWGGADATSELTTPLSSASSFYILLIACW